MKRHIVYSGIIAMLTYCLWGCEEEKTLQYVNNPAINFTGGTGLFSVYRHSRLSGYGIDRRLETWDMRRR